MGNYFTTANITTANIVTVNATTGIITTLNVQTTTSAVLNATTANISTLTASGNIVAASGTESVSTTTGAAVVIGGVGVSGNITAGKVYTGSGLFWSANGVSALAAAGTSSGPTPSESAKYGDLWYNTTNDVVYQYLTDGTSSYWIDISSQTIAANTSNTISGNLTVTGNIKILGSNNFMQLPTYTTGALTGIVGQAGWVAAISTTGQLVHWDVSNSRWSYVADGTAV